MKKLASLLTLLSIGLFAVGCDETGLDEPEPIPGDAPTIEGGSGVIDEEPIDEVPPTIDEAPPLADPALETPPVDFEAETETDVEIDADAAAPELEDAAADESATEAAEAADSAAPE